MNKIYVVGLGPGKEEFTPPQAWHALDDSDTIIG